ncbi:site-specific integrase [Okeania sp. SIO2B3]|uniref:tyrosine-type recombinase/integrase n=1 Tax=Okeania sp. SIO2B3 TaxID=2607784 RepID=UPI0013C065C4|nr:site-specific integrase [Okeania sp. SIO2B3]NET40855.1 site-specific integrase [Okeania sp. SIO2B3]
MVRQKTNKIKAKIGKVNIEIHGGSYRLRFTDPTGKRKAISVCPVSTEDSLKKAELVAKQIDSDMAKYKMGFPDAYDPKLAKYRPGYVPVEKRITLWDYWEDYKKKNCDRVSNSRQATSWRMVNRVFGKIGKNGTHERFIEVAKEMYSGESLRMIQTDINASLEGSDIRLIRFDKPKKDYVKKSRCKEVWNESEINQILEAFRYDKYSDKKGRHSFYYPYTAFLSLTGCRPEEAIALTWDDVDLESRVINIRKAYTHGHLKLSTKTGRERAIPVNDQLKNIIEGSRGGRTKLIFPSPSGSYLNHHNFSQRAFKRVISALYKEGLISKKLPPYSLRNSWITLMLKKDLDLATVAKLAGTSEKMILNHYWGANDNVVIPEI